MTSTHRSVRVAAAVASMRPGRGVRATLHAGTIGVVVALAPLHASAQTPTDKATAESLFDQGRRLLGQGKISEACPKFAESQRVDPAIGTLLNLGDCYERSGKLASAWAQFREAAALARAAGDARREAEATKRAAALEPKMPKLTVSVPPAHELAGLEVRRNGVPLGRPAWGTANPVDPGEHVVEASAPGKRPWRRTVIAEARPTTLLVTVPVLVDAPAVPPGAAPAPVVEASPAPARQVADRDGGWSTQRYVGLGVIGLGIAGLGAGTILGLRARSHNEDSEAHCEGNACDAAGVAMRDDALQAATLSTVGFGVGAAALVGGTVLFFTAPSESTEVGLRFGPQHAGAAVTRKW